MLRTKDTESAKTLLQRGDRYLTTLTIDISHTWNSSYCENIWKELKLVAAKSSTVSITRLNLEKNEIDCNGCNIFVASAISNFKSLQHLNLSCNRIGDIGCIALADALADAKALTYLDLSLNKIGERSCQALAGVLKKCESLILLELSHNLFGDHGCHEVVCALPSLANLTYLGLMGTKFGNEACQALVTALKFLGKLKSLKLDYCENGFSELTEILNSQDLVSLPWVEIRADSARIRNTEDICKLTVALFILNSLKALDLSGVRMENDTLRALALAFGKHKSLMKLVLTNVCRNGDGGCREIAKLLPTLVSLQHLELSDNIRFGAGFKEIFHSMQNLVSLRILILNCNGIGANAEKCDALALALRNMKSLQQLALNCNQICVVGCHALAAALSKLESLTALGMGQNRIDADGCRALIPALTTMKSLRYLNFSENRLDVEACRILAAALPSLKSLQHLNLSNKGHPISKEGCRMLTPTLMTMPTQVVMDPHDFAGHVGCRTCKHVFTDSK
jgi:Ran GTPase-activating protein (RanGAP) involved in mRNA processing and transport